MNSEKVSAMKLNKFIIKSEVIKIGGQKCLNLAYFANCHVQKSLNLSNAIKFWTLSVLSVNLIR